MHCALDIFNEARTCHILEWNKLAIESCLYGM